MLIRPITKEERLQSAQLFAIAFESPFDPNGEAPAGMPNGETPPALPDDGGTPPEKPDGAPEAPNSGSV